MVEKQQLTESEVHSANAITSAQEQSCKLAVSSWQSFEGANKKEIAERVEMHQIYCSLIGHAMPRLQEQLEKIMRDKAIDSSPSALTEPNKHEEYIQWGWLKPLILTDDQDRPIPGRDKDTLPWISIFKPAGLKEELEEMVRGKTVGSAPSEKTPTIESEKYNHNDWLKPLVLFDDLKP